MQIFRPGHYLHWVGCCIHLQRQLRVGSVRRSRKLLLPLHRVPPLLLHEMVRQVWHGGEWLLALCEESLPLPNLNREIQEHCCSPGRRRLRGHNNSILATRGQIYIQSFWWCLAFYFDVCDLVYIFAWSLIWRVTKRREASWRHHMPRYYIKSENKLMMCVFHGCTINNPQHVMSNLGQRI